MFEVETQSLSGRPAAVGSAETFRVDRIAEIANSLRGGTEVKLSKRPSRH